MLPEKRFIVQRDSIDLGRVKISRLFRLYLIPTLLGMLSICAVTAADGILSEGVSAATEFMTALAVVAYYLWLRMKKR